MVLVSFETHTLIRVGLDSNHSGIPCGDVVSVGCGVPDTPIDRSNIVNPIKPYESSNANEGRSLFWRKSRRSNFNQRRSREYTSSSRSPNDIYSIVRVIEYRDNIYVINRCDWDSIQN